MFKRHFELTLFLLISATPVFSFATVFSVTDNYVFFLPANLIFTIFTAYTLYLFSSKKIFKTLSFSILLIPIFYIISYQITLKTEKGNQFNKEKQYKGGLQYYMLPWLYNNVGIIETTLNNSETSEPIDWMKKPAREFIELRIKKGENLRKLENK